MGLAVSTDHEISVLLERWLISHALDRHKERFLEAALDHVRSKLGVDREFGGHEAERLRLRLTMHLAPKEAICYDPGNPRPRHRLIYDYLTRDLGCEGAYVERLARDVAIVLDRWDERRIARREHLDMLLRRQGNKCNHCGLSFSLELRERTPYLLKPYHDDVGTLAEPEVDHVEPIAGFGTNDISNLQVLCRFCNQGKGHRATVDEWTEAKYAAMPYGEIPLGHIAAMHFAVLARDRRTCQISGKTHIDCELTIAPQRPRGGYLRSNLICVAVPLAR